METALPKDEYLDLNDGRYLRESFTMRQCKSSLYLTTHLEAADTGLPHYHESAHLSFILNGSVIDKRRSIETERVTGDLMYFRAGEVHQSIYCEFPAKNINFELEPSFFTQNAITETELETAITGNGRAKFTLLRIYREMMIDDELSQASIEMLLLEMIQSQRPVRSFPSWFRRVLELLNDRWNDELSVVEIAAAVKVHPKTISRYFSRYCGCTLGDYRRRLKVERSLSRIRSTPNSLTEIAQNCGFYDQSHFINSFKQLTGMRPGQFRRI